VLESLREIDGNNLVGYYGRFTRKQIQQAVLNPMIKSMNRPRYALAGSEIVFIPETIDLSLNKKRFV
jgi:hypothetical protein